MTPNPNDLAANLGQLFMVGFHGLTPPPGLIELIQRERVGGIILFSRNCRDARQVSRLTRDLQAAAREAGHDQPLLIAVDQENGLVRRLGAAITNLPGAMALGATGDETLTEEVAAATARELLALGINMNLAPVADVNSNPANPVIGVRSFGQDPALVARLTAAATRGYQAAGMAATLKHFPGHGDTAVDSHLALPVLPHDRARLDTIELIPFRAGVAAGAGALMLAHLRLPGIAPDEDTPASLSPAVTRLARESLGFQGVIMTDCLEMGAVAKSVGVARGAALALQAGADLVLISHTLNRQRAAIAQTRAALASGELAEEPLRQAMGRMRAFKRRFLAWERLPAPVERASVSAPAHQRLRDRGYQRAVTLVRDEARLLPVHLDVGARVAVLACPPARVSQASDSAYPHAALVERVRAHHANTTGVEIGRGAGRVSASAALEMARDASLTILTLLNAGRDPRQASLIRRLLATGRPLIAIGVSDPYDLAAFSALPTCLATYEYTPAALAAAADAIFGAITPRGRLPIMLAAPAISPTAPSA
ncbi:MAG TPA: beta-N-acetylhexosaminidase [Ktedonobacterales bacterium]